MVDSPHRRQVCEYRLIYAILVAGKSARFAEGAMKRLRGELVRRGFASIEREMPEATDWFDQLSTAHRAGQLRGCLEAARVGNYFKNTAAIAGVLATKIQPRTCTLQDLERIKGIGPKTSRFFLRWTDRMERVAVLDVHILRWLRNLGHQVPPSTPPNGKKYLDVEAIFLAEADSRGVHPADLDKHLWLLMNKSGVRE